MLGQIIGLIVGFIWAKLSLSKIDQKKHLNGLRSFEINSEPILSIIIKSSISIRFLRFLRYLPIISLTAFVFVAVGFWAALRGGGYYLGSHT